MSALNETMHLILDKTVSCSVSPNELLIRTFALLGLISVGGMLLNGVGKSFVYPLVYIYAGIKWIYNKIRGKTI